MRDIIHYSLFFSAQRTIIFPYSGTECNNILLWRKSNKIFIGSSRVLETLSGYYYRAECLPANKSLYLDPHPHPHPSPIETDKSGKTEFQSSSSVIDHSAGATSLISQIVSWVEPHDSPILQHPPTQIICKCLAFIP